MSEGNIFRSIPALQASFPPFRSITALLAHTPRVYNKPYWEATAAANLSQGRALWKDSQRDHNTVGHPWSMPRESQTHKLWENSGNAQLIVSSESGWQTGQVSVSALQEHRSPGKRCTEGRCRCQSAYPRCRGDCRILGGAQRGQSVQRGTELNPRQYDSVFPEMWVQALTIIHFQAS